MKSKLTVYCKLLVKSRYTTVWCEQPKTQQFRITRGKITGFSSSERNNTLEQLKSLLRQILCQPREHGMKIWCIFSFSPFSLYSRLLSPCFACFSSHRVQFKGAMWVKSKCLHLFSVNLQCVCTVQGQATCKHHSFDWVLMKQRKQSRSLDTSQDVKGILLNSYDYRLALIWLRRELYLKL